MTLPIIPYLGGKRRLAKHIIPMFPEHNCYVEPFCGGAAIFFMKRPSPVEVINDVNGDLINLYRVVKHHPRELYRQFDGVLASREIFDELCSVNPSNLTDIQRAFRFVYLMKARFGADLSGRPVFGFSSRTPSSFNPKTIERILLDAHGRLKRTTIERLDWFDIIRNYDRKDTLFFCDPPYFKLTGYKEPFGLDEYSKLADLSRSISGKMIITLNDPSDISPMFDHLRSTSVELTYINNGPRDRKKVREMIYCNF